MAIRPVKTFTLAALILLCWGFVGNRANASLISSADSTEATSFQQTTSRPQSEPRTTVLELLEFLAKFDGLNRPAHQSGCGSLPDLVQTGQVGTGVVDAPLATQQMNPTGWLAISDQLDIPPPTALGILRPPRTVPTFSPTV